MKNILYATLILLLLSIPITSKNSIANELQYNDYIEDNSYQYIKSVIKLNILGYSNENDESVPNIFVGTGFSIYADKKTNTSFAITNSHVCDLYLNLNNAIFTFEDYRSITDGFSVGLTGMVTYLTSEQGRDLCLIKLNKYIPPLRIEDYDYKYKLNEKYMTIGAPDGIWPIVSENYISGLYTKESTDLESNSNLIMVYSGIVSYGQSGSPIINKKGKVSGVLFARTSPEGVSYGLLISHKDLIEFLESIDYISALDL